MAFLTDSFNSAAEEALENHTADLGGKWVKKSGASTITIKEGHTALHGANNLYYNPTLSVVDFEYNVTGSWLKKSLTANSLGILFAMNKENESYYEVRWSTTSKEWELLVRKPGKAVSEEEKLGSFKEESPGEHTTFEIQRRYNRIKLYINGVERVNYEGQPITRNGYIGLFSYSGNTSSGLKLEELSVSAVGNYTLEANVPIFFIGGQSNCEGRGNTLEVEAVDPTPEAYTAFYFESGMLHPMNDPWNPNVNAIANGSSAWPSFAVKYRALTNKQIVFIPAWKKAVNGTACAAEATGTAGSWDTTGERFGEGKEVIEAAFSALEAAGATFSKKGVLWVQGERDAEAITSGTITKAKYKERLEVMIARWRETYSSTLPFFIFRTGRPNASDPSGWPQVREVQDEVATAEALTWDVFTNAVNFPSEEKMATNATYTSLHYGQKGLNEMGTVGAENVVAATEVKEEKQKNTNFNMASQDSMNFIHMG